MSKAESGKILDPCLAIVLLGEENFWNVMTGKLDCLYFDRQKCGRKKLITKEYLPIFHHLAKTFREWTSIDLANCLRDHGLADVSTSTMRRALQELNVRKTTAIADVLTDIHKQKRLEWCEKMRLGLHVKPWLFDNWLISDEVRFSLDGHGMPQIHIMKEESRYDAHLQKKAPNYRGSLMYWGVISREGPVCLVKVTGTVDKLEHWGPIKNMNQDHYQDLLMTHLLPYLEEKRGICVSAGKTNYRMYLFFCCEYCPVHDRLIGWLSDFGIVERRCTDCLIVWFTRRCVYSHVENDAPIFWLSGHYSSVLATEKPWFECYWKLLGIHQAGAGEVSRDHAGWHWAPRSGTVGQTDHQGVLREVVRFHPWPSGCSYCQQGSSCEILKVFFWLSLVCFLLKIGVISSLWMFTLNKSDFCRSATFSLVGCKAFCVQLYIYIRIYKYYNTWYTCRFFLPYSFRIRAFSVWVRPAFPVPAW